MLSNSSRPGRVRALVGAAVGARVRLAVLGTTLPVLAAAVGVASCRDTLATAAQPQGTLNSQSLATKAGVEGLLAGAYRALDANNSVLAWGNAASDWVWGSTTSDDALKGSNSGDQPGIQDIDLYNWGTGNTDGYVNDKWRGAYEGVSRANATLNLLTSVQKGSAGAIDAATAASIAGEAIFLRAHYHFSAYRVFGNIPYVRETDTDFRKPNEAASAVLADVIKDLDTAMTLLPASPRSAGRVSKWTAMAYKGRAQMYAAQYAAALTTLRAVQSGGPYGLETSYDHVWTANPSYWNGKETILAYQAAVNDGDPNAYDSNYGERLNFPHSGSHFGCCGFHQPSQNLVNFYTVDGATGLPAAVVSPSTWNSNNAELTGGSATPVDPRLDFTVGRRGAPYKDWGLPANDLSWIRDPVYDGPYNPKKNAHEQANVSTSESTVGWQTTQLNAVKIHIFRYADMLLLLAEAEVEAGSTENARQIVNQIRARAAAGVQGCGYTSSPVDGAAAASNTLLVSTYPSCKGDSRMVVPITDPSIKWANYKVGQYPAGSFSDQNFARNAVRAERRLELAMEGQRFFDLKRWGTFQTVLNDYVAVEKNRLPSYFVGAQPVTARYQYFPIPSAQIELSKKGDTPQLKQNPGW